MKRSTRRPLGSGSFTNARLRRMRIVGMSSLALPTSIALPTVAAASPGSGSTAVASVPPSVTSIPGVAVDAQGVIHYTHASADTQYLSGATTKVVSGQRNSAGGCDLNSSSPAGTDYSVETSFNPSTCEATFVSGQVTPTGAAALGTANPSSAPTGASPISTFGSPLSNIRAQALSAAANNNNGYWSAFNKVSWVDPVDLTIVSIADNLTWQINGASIPWASAYYVPYSEHIGGDVTTRTEGNLWWSSGSTYTESWSDSSWTNSDFEAWVVAVLGISGYAACGFNSDPAHFYLQADTAGWKNATYTSGWDSSNSGGCVDLTWLRQNDGAGSGS